MVFPAAGPPRPGSGGVVLAPGLWGVLDEPSTNRFARRRGPLPPRPCAPRPATRPGAGEHRRPRSPTAGRTPAASALEAEDQLGRSRRGLAPRSGAVRVPAAGRSCTTRPDRRAGWSPVRQRGGHDARLQSEGAQRVELVAGEHHDALGSAGTSVVAPRVPDLPGLRTIVEWSRDRPRRIRRAYARSEHVGTGDLVVLVITSSRPTLGGGPRGAVHSR